MPGGLFVFGLWGSYLGFKILDLRGFIVVRYDDKPDKTDALG
jgi:hypothetical protein